MQKAFWEVENATLGLPSLEQTLNMEACLGLCELHLKAEQQDYSSFSRWPFTFTVTTLWRDP